MLRRTALALCTLLTASVLATATPAGAATPAPSGLSPSGGVEATRTPTFTWERPGAAVSFTVQADNAQDFSTPIFTKSTTNTAYVHDQRLPLGDVYWRVQAQFAGGTRSAWSDDHVTIAGVGAPQPVSPLNHEPVLPPVDPPVLTWDVVPGATGYDIEVDSDEDWVGAAAYSTQSTTFVVPKPQDVGDYFWRVRAKFDGGVVTAWSPAGSYDVQPLEDVTATYPESNQDTEIQDVVLDWDPVPGAIKYEIRVGLDQYFNNLVETKQVYGTRYSPTTTYLNNQYYWQVRPINAAGKPTEWPETVRVFQRRWPQAPVLLHPADTISEPAVDDFYYQWTPVKHATRYELQVGTDINFSPNTYAVCPTAGTTYTAGYSGDKCMPGQGEVTYWRVRALDLPKNVQGIFSPVQRFIYDSGPVVKLTPEPGATVSVPSLSWEAHREAESYDVKVWDATGAQVASTTTYSLSWTPRAALVPSKGPFTWNVVAVDRDGQRSVSYPRRSFSLTSPPASSGQSPLTPLTGKDPTEPTARFPHLSWEPVTGADHYRIEMGVAGSGYWFSSTVAPVLNQTYDYPALTDDGKQFLSPETYQWRAKAYGPSGDLLAVGPVAEFRIAQLEDAHGQQIALDGRALDQGTTCAKALGATETDEQICTGVPATPVLDWDPVPGAAYYMVYVSEDRDLTNMIYDPVIRYTQNTRWTPTVAMEKDALADNQSGKAYFWFIRPCKALGICAPDPASTLDAATHAFRKISPQVDGLVATDGSQGATVTQFANEVTFTWNDYRATNQQVSYAGGAAPAHQTAQSYRIQVSKSPTFASTDLVDERTVDQTTYTPFDRTYPEGDLWWRVQAIDAQNNGLAWSNGGNGAHLVKATRARNLNPLAGNPDLPPGTAEEASDPDAFPAHNTSVPGDTRLRWGAGLFDSTWKVEVYRNDDTTLSQANRVVSTTVSQAAYAPTPLLEPSALAYRWRVQRVDAMGKPGRWSDLGRFFVDGAKPTLDSPLDGSLQRPNGPVLGWNGVARATSYRLEIRQQNGTYSKTVTTKALKWAVDTLLPTGSYTWSVTALNVNGKSLGTSLPRTFRVDSTRPTVVSKSPTSRASRSANFVAKLSEPVKNVSGSTMRIYVKGRTTPLPAAVTLSSDGRIATLNPSKNLVAGKYYTIKLTSGIRDQADNALVATSWRVRAR